MQHQFLLSLKMLTAIREDHQFNPRDPGYLGYLNVGIDLWGDERKEDTWFYIVSRPSVFKPIIDELGLEIVGGRLDLAETVFTEKK
jgi:hypothetical protein